MAALLIGYARVLGCVAAGGVAHAGADGVAGVGDDDDAADGDSRR
jgi:hypothetical protein